MGTERTVVEMDLNEREAVSSARRVARELDTVSSKADAANRKTQQAGRIRGLIDQARSRGLLDESLLRGDIKGAALSRARGTGVGGAAVIGYAAAIGIGKASATGSALLEAHEDGKTIKQAIRQEINEALADLYRRNPLNPAGRLMYQLMNRRMGARKAGEVFDAAMDERVSRLLGEQSQTDAAIEAQAANRRAFLKAFYAEREGRELKRLAEEKRDAQVEQLIEKVRQNTAERMAGLRMPDMPLRVPDRLYQDMQWVRRHMEELRGEILKKRIEANAGS